MAIVGTGYSTVARRALVPIGALAVDASLRAVEDAGLSIEDIDGLSTYPNPSRPGAGTIDGADFVGLEYMGRALRLRDVRWCCSVAQGTIAAAVVQAVQAIKAESCRRVLVWRAMFNPGPGFGQLRLKDARGDAQFTAPYGFAHTVMDFALAYSQYMHRYGSTRADMAKFIVRNRANAAKNPDSVFYGSLIDTETYMSARMVSDPLSLLDCDLPVDGCGAVVIAAIDSESQYQRPAYVAGTASVGLRYRHSLIMSLDDLRDGAEHLAQTLWESAGIGPSAIDHVNVYDGFSYFVFLLLEAFGFCPPGEGYLLAQDEQTATAGPLPLNTSGGALGMGRLHGMPQIIEAVRQLRGVCGDRQLPDVTCSLVQVGSPLIGAAALALTRETHV